VLGDSSFSRELSVLVLDTSINKFGMFFRCEFESSSSNLYTYVSNFGIFFFPLQIQVILSKVEETGSKFLVHITQSSKVEIVNIGTKFHNKLKLGIV
jgi:hypothetical protein